MTELMNSKNWHGVWTALITPLLKSPSGSLSLDVLSLERLLKKQVDSGIRGFVLAGSTGEGSLLPKPLILDLFQEARRIVGKECPLVAGLGILGTRETLKWAEELQSKVQPDAYLASPPAYVKAPQRGLELHFLSLAEALSAPICLYEISGRSASSISLATLRRLLDSRCSQFFVALKDASDDLKRAHEEAQMFAGKVALLSGDDGTFADFMMAGGDGIVSVASHFFPRSFEAIFRLLRSVSSSEKKEEAREVQNRMKVFIDRLFSESNPIPAKSLAAHLGWIQEPVFELPLVPMSEDLFSLLFKEYQSLDQRGLS